MLNDTTKASRVGFVESTSAGVHNDPQKNLQKSRFFFLEVCLWIEMG